MILTYLRKITGKPCPVHIHIRNIIYPVYIILVINHVHSRPVIRVQCDIPHITGICKLIHIEGISGAVTEHKPVSTTVDKDIRIVNTAEGSTAVGDRTNGITQGEHAARQFGRWPVCINPVNGRQTISAFIQAKLANKYTVVVEPVYCNRNICDTQIIWWTWSIEGVGQAAQKDSGGCCSGQICNI